nr:MAG TPA: hypothetical protein [Caudoviricetes sp.]DAL09719.1 MAG TPA_asm: hypothetical protein [Caudoviricetes sp.]
MAACSGGAALRGDSSGNGRQAALPAREMNRRLVRARARLMLFYRGRGRIIP